MSEKFLPFCKPSIDQETINEVVECLKSGWLATGPRVQKFSEMLKKYLDAPHALPLSSGTAGLHLALLGFNLQPEDEVILPALTFVASANTIVMAGGKPVFIDIDLGSRNIDVNKIEAAITPKTRAIMPVHFAGLSVDLDPIYAIAKKHNLRVLEDAAQAIGTTYKNKRIGGFGDTQIFSFHPNKNMTTGEGGCVTTSDAKLAKDVSIRRFHGIDRDAWNRFSKEGKQHYDVVEVGFKYNMMDIQAALGIHQLPKLDNFINRRTELAKRYLEILADWPEWQLPEKANFENKHAWHLFTPLINPKIANITRDNFIDEMKTCNIGVGFHYDATHLFDYYRRNYGYKPGDFPVAEDVTQLIVSLPLFPDMTDAEQDRVISAMKKVFKKG
jgi:dTDP-4-amino-4,6-dideoxygalactose transaminase